MLKTWGEVRFLSTQKLRSKADPGERASVANSWGIEQNFLKGRSVERPIFWEFPIEKGVIS